MRPRRLAAFVAALLFTVAQPAHGFVTLGGSDEDAWLAATSKMQGLSDELDVYAKVWFDAQMTGDRILTAEKMYELQVVTEQAIETMDAMDVRPCFRHVWAGRRESLVLFGEALRLIVIGNPAATPLIQSANNASAYLANRAKSESVAVTCTAAKKSSASAKPYRKR